MDQVEEVKQRLDVAEVIGSYVQLKQAGRNLKGVCPFHHEKTASFMVSPEKQIWHCFGCGEGGDVIKFVMKLEGLEFRDALELLARQAGIELKPVSGRREDKQVKERLYAAHEWAVKYYQATLVKNRVALDYVVTKRRLHRQTIQDFQIGYAPDAWEGLSKFLRKKGFSEDELVRGGLAGRGRGLYDQFRGRIMLPICDATGRPVGFTGRVLGDAEPKYLNTPQTPLYDKSRVIYGLHLAKTAIREANEVVLVEGNMDVIASHQAGIRQVVAASGTALTLDQLKQLSRLTPNIKLAFDSDVAGLTATERAIELGQKLGISLRMVELPAGIKDPDELIQRDPAAWKEAMANAKYIVDYLFDRFAAAFDLTSAVGKRQFSDRLASTLKRLADPVEQDHYVQRLAELVGTSSDSVRRKVETASLDTASAPSKPRQQPVTKLEAPPPRDARLTIEESILGLALAWPDTRLALEDLVPANFGSPDRQEILRHLQHSTAPTDAITKSLPNLSDYVKILTLRGEEEFNSLAPADRSLEAFGLTRRLQTLAQKDAKRQISRQLQVAEQSGDVDLAHKLLEQYQALSEEV